MVASSRKRSRGREVGAKLNPPRSEIFKRELAAGLAARVKSVAEKMGGKAALAEACGLHVSLIYRLIEQNSVPDLENLLKIAKGSNTSPIWLLFGVGTQEAQSEGDGVEEGVLPGRYVLMRAKVAKLHDDERDAISETLAFKADILDKIFGNVERQNLELVAASENALAPWIGEGDLLVIDNSVDRVDRIGFYVLMQGGADVVRRLQPHEDGSVTMVFDNPIYRPEEISAERARALNIVGRVIWRGGRV